MMKSNEFWEKYLLSFNFRFQSKISPSEIRQKGIYRIKTWDTNSRSYKFNQDKTYLEPIHAREVFPCFDQPDMKGNFEIS